MNGNRMRKIISFVMLLALLVTALPWMAITSHAAAPASYENIYAGDSKTISVSGNGNYYKFVPTTTGTYKYWSYNNGSYDPTGLILDASGDQLAYSDDSVGLNFSIEMVLTAGTTYYLQARGCGNNYASFTFKIEAVGQHANPGGVEINQSGNYSLFNSGATGSGYRYSSSSNYDDNSYTNGGYDIYSSASYNSIRTVDLGLSFAVSSVITERAEVTIYAYDVDESSGERDLIYLVDETDGSRTQLSGYLSGRDDQWNSTTLEVPLSELEVGHTYHFELYESVSGWVVYVRTVDLSIAGEFISPEIDDYGFTASIDAYGLVTTNLYLKTNVDVTYNLEYAASYSYEQFASALNQTITATSAGVNKEVTFQLDGNAPDGIYTIEVYIKDGQGNRILTLDTQAAYSKYVQYYAVNYNSNGGSNSVPSDVNAYVAGDSVEVKYDYIPSRSGYTFLGWSTDSAATTPEFSQGGNNTFVISSDVTLYAVWQEDGERPPVVADVWDGTVANSFGGGSGSEYDPYLIYTAEQLAYLAESTNAGTTYSGKYFKLMNNIDLNGLEWTSIGSGYERASSNYSFGGYFDGNFMIVSNFKQTGTHMFGGLFGVVYNGSIFNLGVENVNIDISNSNYCVAGALLGCGIRTVVVENCYSDNCTIETTESSDLAISGGLIGAINDSEGSGSNVNNCYANAVVTATGSGNTAAGGLIGILSWDDGPEYYYVTNCYATGSVTAGTTSYVAAGGLIGLAWGGTINVNNCFADSSTSNTGSSTLRGAVIGRNNSADINIQSAYHNSIYSDTLGGTSTSVSNLKSQSWIESTIGWNFSSTWTYTAGYDYPILSGFNNAIVEPPVNPPVAINRDVLVIMNDRPWGESNVGTIMSQLLTAGQIDSYDIVSVSVAQGRNFSDYGMIYVVRDMQNDSSYDNIVSELEAYVMAGGTLLYGACAQDASGTSIFCTVPGGVSVMRPGSHNGSIVDSDHPIVTGAYSDNVGLLASDIQGRYLSHSYIDESTLPAGYNAIIMGESNHPILAEYGLGNGRVILTTMTWVFYYDDGTSEGSYAPKAYDDLIAYAANAGGNITPPVVNPEADVWDGTVANSFGGGSGSEYDPYLIYTAEQLAYLAQSTNAGNNYAGKYFKLMNNIDLNGLEWTPIGIGDQYYDDTYSNTNVFCGHFDGNRHIIYNLYININSLMKVGLFGSVMGATITSVGVENASVTMTYGLAMSYGSILCGLATNSNINNCYAIGNVDVTNTKTTGGHNATAGLIVARVSGSTIENCYAMGSVHAASTTYGSYKSYAGGIAGMVNSGETATINNCYFVGDLNATSISECGYVGGMLAANFGTVYISRCFASGTFVSDDYASGMVYDASGTSWLTDCYQDVVLTGITMNPGTSISIDDFSVQSWIETNLGWDFTGVWEFKPGEDLPTLQGFGEGGVLPPVHYHSYTESVVDPTCTEMGYTVYTCSCGYTYEDNYTDRLGHLPGSWIIDVEETCTTSGLKHTECQRCYITLDNIYTAPLGHDIVSTVIRETTCTEYGIILHHCTRGDYDEYEYIYSEHNYVLANHVDPTCTVDGYDEYICTICGDQIVNPIPGAHDYFVEITQVATPSTEGIITYTCNNCGDTYTEVIPPRPDATVLLIQDRLPWDHNDNVTLLTRLQAEGYITGWDMTTTSAFDAAVLVNYNVVMIANDQSTASYNRLAYITDTLTDFAYAGGVVIYGACDSGWAGGYINHQLPNGVTKDNYYSRYNYIVNNSHPIVTGSLTDGKSLTDTLLYGNYCSHTYFNSASLPQDANVILQDAHGNATLVEYAVGNGHIIASGLTWEFYYSRDSYAGPSMTYSKSVFDDLVVYAVYLSDPCQHLYNEGTVVDPTCTEDGYTLHTCQNCGSEMRDNFVPALGHDPAETWTIVTDPTTEAEGLQVKYCNLCGEVAESMPIPMLNAAIATITSENTVINGNTIDFYIEVSNSLLIKGAGINLIFDDSLFEFVSAEWIIGGAFVYNIDPGTLAAVAAWTDLVDANTTIFKFTLKAKTLATGATVSASVKLNDEQGIIPLSVVAKTVDIITCPHTNCTFNVVDDNSHVMTCLDCGYGMLESHSFDDANDLVCDDCGYFKGEIGDFDADGDVDSDDAIYLLNASFEPVIYPLNQSGDVDGDGDVDSDDAIYLLYYTFYGAAEYPIVH